MSRFCLKFIFPSLVTCAAVAGLLLPLHPALSQTGPASAEATLDAKRKVAAEMVKAGKFLDALPMLKEVAATRSATYRDYLLLARSQDKLGIAGSIDSYRKVFENTSTSTKDLDERAAHTEADRRIKQLDIYNGKIDAAIEEFARKLDGIRKDAATGGASAVQRIDRIKSALQQSEAKFTSGMTVECPANANWQPTGLQVVVGNTYRVVATGSWRMINKDAGTECDADGLEKYPKLGIGRRGALLGSIERGEPFVLGKDATFTAKSSGMLFLASNDEENGRGDNSGAMRITIKPVNDAP